LAKFTGERGQKGEKRRPKPVSQLKKWPFPGVGAAIGKASKSRATAHQVVKGDPVEWGVKKVGRIFHPTGNPAAKTRPEKESIERETD